MLSRSLAKGVQVAAARANVVSASRRTFASAEDQVLIKRMFTQPNKYIFYTLTSICFAGFMYGQILDSFGKKTYTDIKERYDEEVKIGKRNPVSYTINKDFYLNQK